MMFANYFSSYILIVKVRFKQSIIRNMTPIVDAHVYGLG